MHRRGVLIGTAGSLLTGCWQSTRPVLVHARIADTARRAAGRTSTLRVLYPRGCLANLRPIVASFEGLTGVSVHLIEASLDEISAEVVLAHHLGTSSFDVAIPATFGIPDMVEAGALRPLGPFVEEYAGLGLIEPSLYEHGDRYRGELYGFQSDGDAYVMFYNAPWMADPTHQSHYAEQFGTPLRVAQTWGELDRQLAFFHQPDKGCFGGSLFRNRTYAAWELWSRLHGRGLFPVDDQMEPRWTSDEAIAALQAMVNSTEHLEPGVLDRGLFENFESYARGDKFANVGWGGTQKYLQSSASAMRDQVAHGLLPGGHVDGKLVQLSYFNWGWNYVVSSRSADPRLAFLFAVFASTPEVSTWAVRESEGYFDPFRVEHYQDAEIRRTYGDSFLAVHEKSLRTCMPDFYMQGRGQYFAVLQRAVSAAVRGHMSPRRALETVQRRWNEITEQMGRDRQIEQWRFLKQSYPEIARELFR